LPLTDLSLYVLARVDSLVRSTLADVRDAENLARTLADSRPDVVFHMAAQPLVRESYRVPVETYDVNVMGTVNLLEAVRRCGTVRAMVNVTTDKCYENREWVWGYREDEPLGGHDPYSSSKACSELVTSAYRRSFFKADASGSTGTSIASARAGNVIGGVDFAADRILPDCVRAVLKGETILLRSPGAVRPGSTSLTRSPGISSYRDRCTKTGSGSPPPGTSARKTPMRAPWSGWSGGSARSGARASCGIDRGNTRTRHTN
jgi:CDP-glucose 4,6-dehydratase